MMRMKARLFWFPLLMGVFFLISSMTYSQQLGIGTVGNTVYPAQGLRRVNKLVLSSNNYQGLYGAALDAANGYAYFGGRNGTFSKINLTTFTEENTITLASGGNFSDVVIDNANGFAYFVSGAGGRKVKLMGPGVPPVEEATFSPTGAGPLIDTSNPDPTKHYLYFIGGGIPAVLYKYLLPSPVGGDLDNKAPTLLFTVTMNSPSYPSAGFPVHGTIDTAAGFAYFAGFGSNQIVQIALNGAGAPTENGVLSTSDPVTAGDFFMYGRPPDVDTSGAAHYAYFGLYVPSRNATVVKVNLSSFTEASHTFLNPGTGGCNGPTAMEQMLSAGLGDSASGYTLYGTDGVFPMKIIKVKNGLGNAAPTENAGPPLQLLGGTSVPPCDGNAGVFDSSPDGGLTYPYGEVFAQGAVIDNGAGYAYFGTDSVPGQVVKVAFSQKAAIKGTKVVLAQTETMNAIHFYSHAAAGNVRLAVYDNAAPKNLLWDSGVLANNASGGWITQPIASGNPSSLTLVAGTYWLCWQVDNTLDVPSYTLGNPGDGFFFDQAYGTFPASLNGAQASSETWSEYLDYGASTPTNTPINTPTSSPTNTPTKSPTNSPTNTPTTSLTNTMTNTPTNTPSATASPTSTSTPTLTGTLPPTSTPTNTPANTATNSPTFSPTGTPTPTVTNTPTLTPSNSPTSTATNTTTPTMTNTQMNTATNSPTYTVTMSPTNTYTPSPTSTPTPTPTNTLTFTPTFTDTPCMAGGTPCTSTSTPVAAITPTTLIGNYHTYPNPARGNQVTFYYQLTLPADHVMIKIFTVAQRKIAAFNGTTQGGDNNVPEDSSGWANGVYTYTVEAFAGGIKQRKLGHFIVLK